MSFLIVLPMCIPVDLYDVLAVKGLAPDILVLWKVDILSHQCRQTLPPTKGCQLVTA